MQKSRIETIPGAYRVNYFDSQRWAGPLLFASKGEGAFRTKFHDDERNGLRQFFRSSLSICSFRKQHCLTRVGQENVNIFKGLANSSIPVVFGIVIAIEFLSAGR